MEALKYIKVFPLFIFVLFACSASPAKKIEKPSDFSVENFLVSKDIIGVISLKYDLPNDKAEKIFKDILLDAYNQTINSKVIPDKRNSILEASKKNGIDSKVISSMLIDYRVLGGEVFFKDNFPHSAQDTFKESNLFTTP